MPAKKLRNFRVVYYDRDRLAFNVSEIICDDTAVTNRTCELQRNGRNVNITTTGPEKDRNKVPSIESLLKIYPRGYKYDPELFW